MTHEEPPWKDNYQKGVRYVTIPLDDMKRYFEPMLDTTGDFVDYPNFLNWLESAEGDPWEASSN
jgi:hypothetical protein